MHALEFLRNQYQGGLMVVPHDEVFQLHDTDKPTAR